MQKGQGAPAFRLTLKGLEWNIKNHWCLASYLILNVGIEDIVRWGEMELPEDFSKRMAGYVYAYIYENKMPPADIAQTVLNVSEDLVANRPVQLRAGDYIAAQKFLRGNK